MTRIAMWSGPRNLSTAMMYAFGNRSDCIAVDEPLYAAYLAQTGLVHPMQDAILASQPTNAQDALMALNQPQTLQYEKHMTHHMLPTFSRDWLGDVKNAFLIRHPARVIASYQAKRESPTFDDLGFAQQLQLFETFGGVVIDSADIRADPRQMLGKLCDALGILFDEAMLSWPCGPKDFDGVWADHWYGAVHNSTGFSGAEGPLPEVTKENAPLLERALPIYETLSKHCLKPD